MPLFDSICKAIGTATQAISDAAKDISEGFQSAKREEQDSSRCPSCGQPLSGMLSDSDANLSLKRRQRDFRIWRWTVETRIKTISFPKYAKRINN